VVVVVVVVVLLLLLWLLLLLLLLLLPRPRHQEPEQRAPLPQKVVRGGHLDPNRRPGKRREGRHAGSGQSSGLRPRRRRDGGDGEEGKEGARRARGDHQLTDHRLRRRPPR
jgi:hypothetical protein